MFLGVKVVNGYLFSLPAKESNQNASHFASGEEGKRILRARENARWSGLRPGVLFTTSNAMGPVTFIENRLEPQHSPTHVTGPRTGSHAPLTLRRAVEHTDHRPLVTGNELIGAIHHLTTKA